MQSKLRRKSQTIIPAYASLGALANDWRGILPLTRPYATADEFAAIPATLLHELYPVTPGEVYERLLGALTTEAVTKRARSQIVKEINRARYLELILRYEVDFPSSATLHTCQEIQHRLSWTVEYQARVVLGQQLYALGMLVSTMGRAEGWQSEDTLTIRGSRGEALHTGNRETVTVACLATYTPLMHRLAAYVHGIEKAVAAV